MLIRPAQQGDASGIARVHVQSWRSSYAGIVPAEYLAKLSYEARVLSWDAALRKAAAGEGFVHVAQIPDGRIVGFASGGPERSGDPLYTGELYAIYILREHQGQGVGRKLCRAIVQDLVRSGHQAMLIWVLAQNPARHFYEALGGKSVYRQEIQIGTATLDNLGYGWTELNGEAGSAYFHSRSI